MPTRPGRPCATPSCPNIVHRSSYCPEHEATRRRKDPEQAKFYNSTRWKQLRKIVRAQEPICAICRTNPSTNVDHIDGDFTNNARENLRALCSTCERSRTASQHRGSSKAPIAPGCDEAGIPIDPRHHWKVG